MIQRTGADGAGNVLFVQNNVYYDAFFLKAIGAFAVMLFGWYCVFLCSCNIL